MASAFRRQSVWLRRGALALLGLLWVAWLLLALPDGGRRQYSRPLDAGQFAADIRAGEVVGVLTQEGNARIDIIYRDDRPVTSAHLPAGVHLDDALRPYGLAAATSPGVRYTAIPSAPATAATWFQVLRSYWLPPLVPPLLAAGLAFLLYNIVGTFRFLVVPGDRSAERA